MKPFLILVALTGIACAQATQPLRLEKTIDLPDVQGRIDHMSIDVKGERLFVSALGNNTLEVIDLKAGTRAKTISQLKEPQGVVYVPKAAACMLPTRKTVVFGYLMRVLTHLLRLWITAMTQTTCVTILHANESTSAMGAARWARSMVTTRSLTQNSTPIRSHFSLKQTVRESM